MMLFSKTPLISVVVPVFNVETYLPRCVESLVAQTYTNLEIILVDDGSCDKSPKLCDDFAEKDGRVRVIHKINGGLSDARNVGIDAATGEYLSFVDGDDVVHPDFIGELFAAIVNTGKRMSVCKFRFFSDGSPLVFCSHNESVKVLTLDESIRDYCSLTPEKSTPLISCCTKLYHKSLFQNLRFPVGCIYEDAAISYKVLDGADGVALVEESLYGYYMRSNSIMGQKETHSSKDVLKPYQDAISYFWEKGKEDVAHLFYPPLIMREIYRYWIAKTQKKDVQEAGILLTMIRNDCRKMNSFENVDLKLKVIFSLIACFPFIYSFYRKVAPGFVGGR